MSDIKQQLDDRWADAWDAMEDAIVKLNELNDFCFDEAGEPLFNVPRVQAQVLAAKGKEITQELQTFLSIQEPSRALPQLPLIAA